MQAMWNEIQALTASRDEQLEKEQAKQQGRDELRKEFAQVVCMAAVSFANPRVSDFNALRCCCICALFRLAIVRT
jgi:hypothetical protein